MANTPAEGTTIRRFLELLEAAQLLNAADWAAVQAQLPEAKRDQDAAEVARKLVVQHALTKHQAASLYQQRPKNLGIGPYIFLDRLGTGGSGSVYKAKHRQTEAVVAVKVLNLSGSRSPDALKRFQREAETAARLNHPNIVRALDTGEAGGQYYTAMELVEGTDLSTYIKKQGPLAFGQAAHCVVTAARALAYAHEQGIIHRDIKPANIMLCNDGTIKVLDMGLARLQDPSATGNDQAAEGLTQTGQVMGTVDYMAPEQALHTRLADARADVYGLGCTLYRLVTGDIPYDGDSMVAKILAHREMPIPSLQRKNSKVPTAADIVLQRMLAKKPEDRYQTMNELADDLERCMQGIAIAPLAPAVNVPTALSHSPDSDSRSNSFTIGISGMSSSIGQAGDAHGSRAKGKSKSRKRSKLVPLTIGAVLLLAAGGVGWMMTQSDPLAMNDPDGPEKAIPPKPPEPLPSGTVPGSSPGATNGLVPLPTATGAASTPSQNRPPVGAVAAGTKPVIDFGGGVLPASPSSTGSTSQTVATPTFSPGYTGERDFAAWCFDQGYRINVHIPSVPSFNQTLTSFNNMPAGDFAVITVYLQGSRPLNKAVFEKLATAPFLGTLNCYTTTIPVEPGAWQNLALLPRLHVFTSRLQFTDADAAALRSLTELRFLDLANSQIGDAALDAIGSLPNLAYLNLSNLPSITGPGLSKLSRASLLRRLNLRGSPIGDSAVTALSTLPSLQSVNLVDTQFTDAGKQRLAAALPGCDVFSTTWYGPPIQRPSIDAIAAATRAAVPSAVPNGTAIATGLGGMVNATPQPTPGVATPPVSFEAKKLPVPTDDNLAPSLKLIREELFKDKYAAAKKPEERASLGAELLGQVKDLGDDANGIYAMLREARDLAVEGGDMSLAFSACNDAEQRYEMNALVWLAEACEAGVKKPQIRTVSRSMAEGLSFKVEDAIAVQNYDAAERLLDTALAAARKSQDAALTKQLVERDKTLTVQKKLYDEVVAARKTLTDTADDPAANLVLGKYECFVEGKWDEGLPRLAKGSDPIFKDLAGKSTGTTSAERAAAGDLWWTQGEKSPKAAQKDFLLAALHLYEKAALELTGLQKTRIDKRIVDARVALGDAAPKPMFGVSSLPASTGVSLPPNSPTTNAAAAAAGLPPDQQRFIAFVFARGGGVVIEAWSMLSGGGVSTNSFSTQTCYSDAEISRLSGRIRNGVSGASFYATRGSRLSDDDLRTMASAPWIRRLTIDGMPLTNASFTLIGGMANLEQLIITNAPQISDVGIAALARNGRLTSLTLNQTGVTGSGLARLNAVPLSTLNLNQSRLDDAGMVGMAALSQLRTVSFDETSVTEAGLARLAVLQNLDSIHATNTRINGSSFANFASGLNIDYLYLSGTQVNDAALTAIGRMTDLDGLYMDNTQVTDIGIAKLSGLGSLNTLYLNGCTRVTDASVATFVRLRNLFTLYARGTGMTANAAQVIRAQLPNCNAYTQ